MDHTPWNILVSPEYDRNVRMVILDNDGGHTERYTVHLRDGSMTVQEGDFIRLVTLADQHRLPVAVSASFIHPQRIGLGLGTGNTELDLLCFDQEIQQVLLLPPEQRAFAVEFSPPDRLILGGYSVSAHIHKRRIGEVSWQKLAEVYADGRIEFSHRTPAMA